jgi:hypothetical protein
MLFENTKRRAKKGRRFIRRERLMKIMNRFWLKITGVTVLTLVAIAGVYVFWPAKTKPVPD